MPKLNLLEPVEPSMCVENLALCRFYHTMDLPGIGLVRGEWDIRGHFDEYIGHVRLESATVLDLGTASGYLSFEAERRGASVLSFDAETAAQFRCLPFHSRIYMQNHAAWVKMAEEGFERFKRGYWLAHRLLGSSALVKYGDIYTLDKYFEKFDVVVAGALLEHLSDPISALASMARVARDYIILAFTPVLETEEEYAKPLIPWTDPQNDTTWWCFTLGLYRRLFDMLGFQIESIQYVSAFHEVSGVEVPRHTLVARRAALPNSSASMQDGSPAIGIWGIQIGRKNLT